MKKLILSGILAIGTVLAVKAQSVKFGVKGGLNLAKITNESSSKTRASFYAGGLANIALDQHWAIQPELLYSGQGTKMKSSYLGGLITAESTLKTDYINIPVMVQYSIVPAFYLEAGPQLGILAGAKLKGGNVSVDVKDQMKSIDFGIGVGFGYKFDMGLGVSGRYNFGLTNLNESDKQTNKNSVAQIGLFYMF
ncbi:Outer membrane protein beta-barrel domain-containing protein [Chitinophaga eiseniae]|uniref:Outer membrane protein beta-barrel domain-containing protein n=1 Tax=Chitinophaga eiseniae TaxID=634771 RepID=A0A1T4TKA7_9BACT|nr:porin family protein [Chitinophaga eiseniae]SKA40882.1 Outer membrane protein beta-barrel domain-containing protein [Chitinophaga eiseniae]